MPSSDSSDEGDSDMSDSYETVTGSQDSEMEEKDSLPTPSNKWKEKQWREFTWKSDVIQPAIHSFTVLSQIDPDLLSTLSDQPKPLDFLSFILHDKFIDILVHETNRYAEQYVANASLGPQSQIHIWKQLTG